MKLNCWEYCKCGRQPGGERARDLGICPVTVATSLNGVNGGINGGRICWSIAGTFSPYRRPQLDCLRIKEIKSCLDCEFHKMVLQEEGLDIGPLPEKPTSLEFELP